jgi:hypothetical protein
MINGVPIRNKQWGPGRTSAWAIAAIAAVVALSSCAPTTWTLTLYDFGPSEVVARVTADGKTTDRVVRAYGSGVAYRGERRPTAVSVTFLDSETCAVIATYDAIPQVSASVIVNEYGEVGSEEDDEAAVGGLLELDTRCWPTDESSRR